MSGSRLRGAVGLALTLVLLASCGQRAGPERATANVTLRIDLGGSGEIAVAGVPYDPSGDWAAVTEAELRVFTGGVELFFDANGDQVAVGGVQLLLTSGPLTLHLPPGTYDFEVVGRDESGNELADGSLLDVEVVADASLMVNLLSFIESVNLAEPGAVVPNQVVDVRLSVHPPGRSDLAVPTSDFTTSFQSSARVLGSSALGVRLAVECQPVDVSVEVSDLRGSQPVSTSVSFEAADICSSYQGGIGVDLIPPFLEVLEAPSAATVGVPVTVAGEVTDFQSAVASVSIFDGPVWIADAVIDDTVVPNTWTVNFELEAARDYSLTFVAADGAGNESRVGLPLSAEAQVGFIYIDAGASHSCGLLADGSAYCWGSGDNGKLGNGSTAPSSVPVEVSGDIHFVDLDVGQDHTCGVALDGSAYCWGSGSGGRLGTGAQASTSVPLPVVGDLEFVSVSAWIHTCGIVAEGSTYCWGGGSSGQLGNGVAQSSLVPVPVESELQFVSVGTGVAFSCGVVVGGSAYCWGNGINGQLGQGANASSLVPVAVSGGLDFIEIIGGNSHACGVVAGGDAYCWGSGSSGQLGRGNTAGSLVPAPVSGGIAFSSISTFFNHTCGTAIDGVAYCWGNGFEGQLGTGESGVDGSNTVPTLVSGGLDFQNVSTGYAHTCGVDLDAAAYCWGTGISGQLGAGATTFSAVPVAVMDLAP